jgi:glycosyltransferase involved in cell wall biosynthesis
VIAVAHGDLDFYYDLAVKNEPVVDAWIAISERIRKQLTAVVPHRSGDIFLIPFGVQIPASARTPVPGRLRALYVGRLSLDKGIFDLPAIDRTLRDQNVEVAWTIQGTGPDEAELRARWKDRTDIAWKGYQPMGVVLDQYHVQDILVMPSRSEGLPVALLEAGASGVVPIVSNLLSGIPDVVEPGVTGFRPEVGDIAGFAQAIARVDRDRSLLEGLSRAVRARVEGGFNAVTRTAEYQQLFARWPELRRSRDQRLVLPYGSRLDRPWIPNPVVRAIRSTLKKP